MDLKKMTMISISPYAIPAVKMAGIENPYYFTSKQQANQVIEIILNHYGLKWEDIDRKTRRREIIIPRQVIMYFMKVHLHMTLKSVGELFTQKFDHTTVIHARDTVQDLIDTGVLQKDVLAILNKING